MNLKCQDLVFTKSPWALGYKETGERGKKGSTLGGEPWPGKNNVGINWIDGTGMAQSSMKSFKSIKLFDGYNIYVQLFN